jgi:hypothetical protein
MTLALHARSTNALFFFQKNRRCPICDWQGFQFLPSWPGPYFRQDAMCPRCSSWERQRLAYTLLEGSLPKRLGKVLHFAPEACIQNWLKPLSDEYHTADLMDRGAMHQVDIQNMSFADDSFDFVWCSHVLEHVPDDRRAMREIGRVLRPGGMAVIQVPAWGKETDERPLSSDQERLMKYFQEDHLRRYGKDFGQRLQESGLRISVRSIEDVEMHLVRKYGLDDPGGPDVFVATKAET